MVEASVIEPFITNSEGSLYTLNPVSDSHKEELEEILEAAAISTARHDINDYLGALTLAQVLPNKVETHNQIFYDELMATQKSFSKYIIESGKTHPTFDEFSKGIAPHIDELYELVTHWMRLESEHLFSAPYQEQFAQIVASYIGIMKVMASLTGSDMAIHLCKEKVSLNKEGEDYSYVLY